VQFRSIVKTFSSFRFPRFTKIDTELVDTDGWRKDQYYALHAGVRVTFLKWNFLCRVSRSWRNTKKTAMAAISNWTGKGGHTAFQLNKKTGATAADSNLM
jgi:hypothetical protein